MAKVVVMDHPLIQHKIGIMRRTETGSKDFRTYSRAVVAEREAAAGKREPKEEGGTA